jgi:predicted transcriptional regulator
MDWEHRTDSSQTVFHMPPRPSITLTKAELRLMKVLWSRGESTVADVVAATAPDGELAYTSVLTIIRILENKGYVRHRQEGRAFLYSSTVCEAEASRSEVRHVLQRFFGNSPERLVLSLLGDGEVTPEELRRLKEAIANAPEEVTEEPEALATGRKTAAREPEDEPEVA